MNHKSKTLGLTLCVLSAILLAGCGGSVTVKKLSSEKDEGIPYYLPKPYLLITRGLSATVYKPKVTETVTEKSSNGTKTTTTVTEQAVGTPNTDKTAYSMEIVYLPDLRDKYGITIKSGSGTSDTKITLENGWRLTSLAEISDTKIADTIKATAELASAITPAIAEILKNIEIPSTKEVPSSISIYEMVLLDGKVQFNLVFQWPKK
jgi:nitrogen fixation protein